MALWGLDREVTQPIRLVLNVPMEGYALREKLCTQRISILDSEKSIALVVLT
jgi:hypothetical protein